MELPAGTPADFSHSFSCSTPLSTRILFFSFFKRERQTDTFFFGFCCYFLLSFCGKEHRKPSAAADFAGFKSSVKIFGEISQRLLPVWWPYFFQ
jgi:hypothetical protein